MHVARRAVHRIAAQDENPPHAARLQIVREFDEIPRDEPITPAAVHSKIRNKFKTKAVPNAIHQGLTFDEAGNANGAPEIVRICPLPEDATTAPRTAALSMDPEESGPDAPNPGGCNVL